MQRALAGVVAVVLVHFSTTLAVAVPPKVIKAVPDNGDIGVDPNLNAITITFDQPMAEGMSPVGGGETFPKKESGVGQEHSSTMAHLELITSSRFRTTSAGHL